MMVCAGTEVTSSFVEVLGGQQDVPDILQVAPAHEALHQLCPLVKGSLPLWLARIAFCVVLCVAHAAWGTVPHCTLRLQAVLAAAGSWGNSTQVMTEF
jgi:hypothetical protein